MCNNALELRQMVRLFPTSLAVLLVISSLGHAFAAVFCPHPMGRECCFAKAPDHTHATSHQNAAMLDTPMGSMQMDDMHGVQMNEMAIDDMAMPDRGTDGSTMKGMSAISYLPVGDNESLANRIGQPMESCPHCLSHSGILNAPISSLSLPDQSSKDLGLVPLLVSRFLIPAATTLAQIGPPRDHAPPGSSAPLYILINVFLI